MLLSDNPMKLCWTVEDYSNFSRLVGMVHLMVRYIPRITLLRTHLKRENFTQLLATNSLMSCIFSAFCIKRRSSCDISIVSSAKESTKSLLSRAFFPCVWKNCTHMRVFLTRFSREFKVKYLWAVLSACAPWTRDEEISSTLKIIQTSVNLQKKFNTTHILRKIRNFAIFLQTFENNREMTNLSQRGKIFTI